MTCILVVEDESGMREVLVELLREAGFEIVETDSAEEAVELLDRGGCEIIVTDINLPGRLDGIDLALAARKSRPRIPVIFMSGRPAKLAEAHALGAPAAFLQKPFSFKTLIGDIQRLANSEHAHVDRAVRTA